MLVFSISPAPSYFRAIKPAMAAGTLTNVNVVPVTDLPLIHQTYDFFLRTATTTTIKTIDINFPVVPNGFNAGSANTVIERNGIGPGSIGGSGTLLRYTVTNPVSIAAGTTIRLEVSSIVVNTEGTFQVSMMTKDTTGSIIDGPTASRSFKFVLPGPP